MTAPYFQDDSVTLHHGDALDVLTTMSDQSVGCIVTSPPYFGLRDYGVPGQIGAEPTPAEFVAALVAVFREARRVLADDGTFWLNLGDSYNTAGTRQGHRDGFSKDGLNHAKWYGRNTSGLPGKNLLGIPWRVAFALQDDGWILRNSIIWHKPNAMPESVTDRLSRRHENLFMFSKSPRYWFDLDPIREPHGDKTGGTAGFYGDDRYTGGTAHSGLGKVRYNEAGRNPGDVWAINTQPFSEAHFAVFPLALAERCVLAGAKPGTAVLDPFSGSGTTGMAAAKHDRTYVGIDLSADYLALSLRTRLAQSQLDLEGRNRTDERPPISPRRSPDSALRDRGNRRVDHVPVPVPELDAGRDPRADFRDPQRDGGPLVNDHFSGMVKAKARRFAAEEGRVRPRSCAPSGDGSWSVTGAQGEVYLVQVVLDGREVQQVTCECQHGLNAGGTARCSHALAVLITIVRRERAVASGNAPRNSGGTP